MYELLHLNLGGGWGGGSDIWEADGMQTASG